MKISNIILGTVAAFLLIAGFAIQEASSNPYREYKDYTYDDAVCLAQNIYFEARNQSKLGQIAVSLVVLERVRQDTYPNDICGVVKQGSLSTGDIYGYYRDEETNELIRYPSCQFSWYCDGLPDDMANEEKRIEAMRVAWYVLHNPDMWNMLEGADHYHAINVTPSWAGTAVRHRITQIDDHIFWRR